MPRHPNQKAKRAPAPKAAAPAAPTCHFCALPQSQVDLLICGEGDLMPNICDSCVGVAAQLVNEYHRARDEEEDLH